MADAIHKTKSIIETFKIQMKCKSGNPQPYKMLNGVWN